MSDFAMISADNAYRPKPGHAPRNRQERHRRVQKYVLALGNCAVDNLHQVIDSLSQTLQELAPSGGLDLKAEQLRMATKELVCLWIHLEAIEQGGDGMPTWLLDYLKLSLYATDYLIAEPPATSIMAAHAHLDNLELLHVAVAENLAKYLGFEGNTKALGPTFVPLLADTRALRQKILKDSLTAQVD